MNGPAEMCCNIHYHFQWKHDVGSTICAYVHNVKNWTGLGGEEFIVRDFIPTESTVFLLGRPFSLLQDENSVQQKMWGYPPSELGSGPAGPSAQSLRTNLAAAVRDRSHETSAAPALSSEYETVHNRLEKFIDSFIFMSYRRDFPPMYRFENEGSILDVHETNLPDVIKVTSDAGWGCTIRCAQMLLFEVLKRHFPTPEAVWESSKGRSLEKGSTRHKNNRSFQKTRDRSLSSPTIGYQVLDSKGNVEDPRYISNAQSPLSGDEQQSFRYMSSSPMFDEIKNEMLLRWFLDVPSPPENHPFSVYAFVRSAGGGLGWAHPLYGQMALESKLLMSLFQQQQQAEFKESSYRHHHSALIPYCASVPSYPTVVRSKAPTSLPSKTVSSVKRSFSCECCRDASLPHRVSSFHSSCDTHSTSDQGSIEASSLEALEASQYPQSEDASTLLQSPLFSSVLVPSLSSPRQSSFTGLPPLLSIDPPKDPIFFGKRPGDW